MAQLKDTTIHGDLTIGTGGSILFADTTKKFPLVYKGIYATKASNNTPCSKVTFGYANNTLYIWTDE